MLPKGADKDVIGRKIEEAEKALDRADAQLAKELGYTLPKPMLWNEQRKLFVCQNPDCARTMHRGMYISDEALQMASKKFPRYR
jgi:hypothetical protein